MNNTEAFKKQKEVLDYYQEHDPAMLVRPKNRKEEDIALEIGMLNLPAHREKGFLRLAPQDFIVEEKTNDGLMVTVDDLKITNPVKNNEKENTLFAHLIKIGLPTEAALARVAQELKISPTKIGFAGLKDAEAITAQLIAFPNTHLVPTDLQKANSSQLFFSNIVYSKGTLNPGDLEKNIFTITIRTEKELNENEIAEKIANIQECGVLNYFHYQRFGGLRLISHLLGKFILRGEYEEAVKKFLCEGNEYDIPLVAKLRLEATKNYANWEKMEEIFSTLPYTFFVELKFLDYLKKDPKNFIGALIAVPDQTKLWVYAYTSWLFNFFISEESQKENGVDLEVPTLLSDDAVDMRFYQKYLERDGTKNFQTYLKPFPFISCKRRMIETYIFPEVYNFKVLGKNLIIFFGLKSGAYATTFLSNLFELHQGYPIPEWVDKTDYDPKEELGEGSLQELKKIFKDSWKSKE